MFLRERVVCAAMDKAFRFLVTADADRIARVSDEIRLRCRTDAERAAVCGTLTQVIARVRPEAGAPSAP